MGMSEAVEQQESLSYKIRGLKDKDPFNVDSKGLETVGDLMTKIIAIKNLDYSLKLIYSGKVIEPEKKLSEVGYAPDRYFVFIEDKKKIVKQETKEENLPQPQPVNSEQPANSQPPADQNQESIFQESSALNDANREGIYANIFVTLIKMAENTDKLAEQLNDIDLLKTIMKDQKVAHTLMALSPEL